MTASGGGRYDVLETLRRGDGAALERVVRKDGGGRVLLKILLHPRASEVKQLHNELALASALGLSCVVRPLELDTVEGQPALVREDVDGEPLDRILGAPMGIERFLRIAISVARAVEQVHQRGVVHRLLRAESIFVNETTGEAKISDFGMAFRLARAPSAAQFAGLVEGALSHMSPEQTGRINRVTDTRSDLYSLGVTFYQMLTGRLPFLAADPLEWIHLHIARSPAPAVEVAPSIPEQLSAMVMQLLAKSAEDRYQTAAGLRHDLERCLAEWKAKGRIGPFPLRERDVPERFLVPQRLHGRGEPTAVLLGLLERVVATGTPVLALVSGHAGVGKSSLVQTLGRRVVEVHGFFASGKYDRHKRDIPYGTIAEAGRQLVLQILAEGDEHIATWKARLEAVLGRSAGLLVDLIPELKLVIGPQPPVPELPLSEAQNRFQAVFLRFVEAFAKKEHPTTLFLDDLQWVDLASLNLLARLATLPEAAHLLLVGAYRDDEVTPTHPLMAALDQARNAGAVIEHIALGPLSVEQVNQLVADIVHRPPSEAIPLGRLVHEKTAGNPFFAVQFLADLDAKGLLEFVPREAAWRWDTAKIRTQGYTDNVVDLMVAKLQRLKPSVRELVAMVACVGNATDVRTLGLLSDKADEDIHHDLLEAVDEGLLGRQNGVYRFSHDRVEEAAYALTPVASLGDRHLQIGRLLLSRATPAEQDERIFDIAVHLNRGASRIKDRAEKAAAAEVSRLAGERAMASAAFASAAAFFAAGITHLGPDCFDVQYRLAFALHLQQARCELSSGNIETAARLLGVLGAMARGRHDRASVCLLQIHLHMLNGEMHQAVAVALDACADLFGMCLEPHPSSDKVGEAITEVWTMLGQHDIETLVDLPRMTDSDMRDASVILSTVSPAVFYAGEVNLYDLIICHLARITLEYGNSDVGDVAPVAYVKLGLLAIRRGRPDDACRLAKVAEALVERYQLVAAKARTQFLVTGLIHSWVHHPRETLTEFERAGALAVEAGYPTETSSRGQAALCAFASGMPLSEVMTVAAQGLELAQRKRFQPLLLGLADAVAWLVRALQSTHRVDDLSEATSPVGHFYRCLYKMVKSLVFGEFREAANLALEGRDYVALVRDLPPSSEYVYYAGLALAAHHGDAPPSEQGNLRRLLAEHLEQVRRWAEMNPAAQRARHRLLAAELARIDGRSGQAVSLYDDAIQSAGDQGLLHERALACEIAARFYRGRGRDRVADAHLADARASYARWGADAKVAELDRRFPRIAERRVIAGANDFTASAEHIDLLSVIKASQSVSSEIRLEKLVSALMQIVIEQAGAGRGCLLLARLSKLALVAEATFDGDEGSVRLTEQADPASLVPLTIVDAARRDKEPIVLDDAAASPRFASDTWFAAHRPRSLLCLPILRQSDVIGVLYLENNLIAGTFTHDRIAVLQILAAQAAISLQNAQLLEQEHAARAHAEEAERRSAWLAEASRVLGESLELGPTLRQLARVAVRHLADWCVIDLVENGEIRRVAGVHSRPAKQPILDELLQRYPPRLGSPQPAATVLSTGEPLLLPELAEAGIRAFCVNDDNARLIIELGTGSAIAMPLVARDKVLGAITFASARAGRYGPADLELGQELARRAAIAIDNAGLYRESQEAVRLRDEFLSIASHELRTPIHSLQLVVQGLTSGIVSPTPDRMLRAFATAERQIHRLTRLIDELLEVTRIQAGRLTLQLEQVDLAAVVGDVVKQFETELARARCILSVRADPAVTGCWDRGKLEQVVANLLSNAIKFGAGKPIEVAVEADGPRAARLVVTDHGIGIPPERVSSIFGRFERAVSAREYGGLGLGLYIVRSIINALGGSVEVKSAPGAGSTFTVKLLNAGSPSEKDPGLSQPSPLVSSSAKRSNDSAKRSNDASAPGLCPPG